MGLGFTKEYWKLNTKKTKILTQAQTLLALKQISEGRKAYIYASKLEFEIAEKFPKFRFIHLISAFYCAFEGKNLEMCEKSYKLLEMINKKGLNDIQIQEIVNTEKDLKKMRIFHQIFIQNLKKICSAKDCENKIRLGIALREFLKFFNNNTIRNHKKEIEKKFLNIWQNPKVSFLCCSCYYKYQKTLKEEKKHIRLINKVKRICEKHKFEFNPNNINLDPSSEKS